MVTSKYLQKILVLLVVLLYFGGQAFAAILTISPRPTGGTVTSNIGGIDCGYNSNDCTSSNISSGTVVTLTATPMSENYVFTSWSVGSQSSTKNPLTITVLRAYIDPFTGQVNFSYHASINGTCGSSSGGSFTYPPSSNLCESGNATSLTSSSDGWAWSCLGAYGGSDASCTATVSWSDVDNDRDGYTENQGDCDDTTSSINPDATEICNDGIDQDCSGTDLLCPTDIDDDGVADDEDNCPEVPNINQSDVNGDGTGDACDTVSDTDGDGLTDAKEFQCQSDPLDSMSMCSKVLPWLMLLLDEPAILPPTQDKTWYKDADGDGYSDGTMVARIYQPVGYVSAESLTATYGDCDDGAASVHPGAIEVCGDGVDNDCSGGDAICPKSSTLRITNNVPQGSGSDRILSIRISTNLNGICPTGGSSYEILSPGDQTCYYLMGDDVGPGESLDIDVSALPSSYYLYISFGIWDSSGCASGYWKKKKMWSLDVNNNVWFGPLLAMAINQDPGTLLPLVITYNSDKKIPVATFVESGDVTDFEYVSEDPLTGAGCYWL